MGGEINIPCVTGPDTGGTQGWLHWGRQAQRKNSKQEGRSLERICSERNSGLSRAKTPGSQDYTIYRFCHSLGSCSLGRRKHYVISTACKVDKV